MTDKQVFMIAVFSRRRDRSGGRSEALKCLAVISETSGISFQTGRGSSVGPQRMHAGCPCRN